MVKTSPRPKVAVIGCGGTIASLGTSSLDLMDYPEHGTKLSVEQILERVPEASTVAELVAVPFRSVGSNNLTAADWFELRATLRQLSREQPDLAGFVILHGTATLEETAFFLNLTLDMPQTTVLTGSQRPISAVGSDAPMNLISAIRVAADASSRERGVLVVFNDGIHAARDVIKVSTLRLDTFRSMDFGVLGTVDPDGIHYYRSAGQRHAPLGAFNTLPDHTQLPRVDIVYSYVGADETFIEAALAKGAKGIVSAGLAPGLSTRAEKQALETAIGHGIAVVQCTRAPLGRVAHRQYLRDAGLISGEDFSPQKARILLALGLTQTNQVEKLRGYFQTH
ncbi:asparaginase [Dyella subtropica]|uniref:asparaginase n=1 Tax=Dyella subtropica TaxID=2992127 RepID=UPI00225A53ED|nr:asparaginase [Dyella subtropica]